MSYSLYSNRYGNHDFGSASSQKSLYGSNSSLGSNYSSGGGAYSTGGGAYSTGGGAYSAGAYPSVGGAYSSVGGAYSGPYSGSYGGAYSSVGGAYSSSDRPYSAGSSYSGGGTSYVSPSLPITSPDTRYGHQASLPPSGLSSSYGAGGFGPASGYNSRSSSTCSLRDVGGDSSRYGSSRYGDLSSTSSLYDSSSSRFARDRPSSYHSGYARSQSSTSLPDKEIDYKRLYEEQKEENEKLRKSVTKLTQELSDTKVDLEKLRLRAEPRGTGETAAERKEKRTLERKISELEEELRLMENLKQDNQRLKEENGALIRVISKLSK